MAAWTTQRHHRHVALALPAAHEREERPVAAKRVVVARSDEHRGVDRRQRRHGDHRADELLADRSERRLHDVGADRLACLQAIEAQAVHQREHDEQVDRSEHADRDHQHGHDRALPATHLGRDVGRLVPAAEGEQHEHERQAEHRRHAGGAAAGAAAAGACATKPAMTTSTRPPTSTTVRMFCARDDSRSPDQVDRREDHDHEHRVDCRRVGSERDDARQVVAADVRQQRDRAGEDHRDARPAEEEAEIAAVGARQEVVVAAGVRERRGHLGVAERADKRQQRAADPGREHPARSCR